jgi:hypothetical protein
MRPRLLTTLMRLTAIVGGASFVSVLGLFAFRAVAPLDDLLAASDQIGNYLQTVGGIYAVLLAFVVYVVWGQFDAARALVDREATALVDLHRTASGLAPSTRDEIQVGLREYVDAVLRDEWRAMAHSDEQTITRVGEILDHVWVAIHRCRPTTECQQTIYGEVLSQFNDLTDVRTSRLTSSRQRIPAGMKVLLYAGAVIMIGSAYMMMFTQLWIHAVVVASLSGAIAHILFLSIDLDDPFAGRWQIERAPFERARRAFDRATHAIDAECAA